MCDSLVACEFSAARLGCGEQVVVATKCTENNAFGVFVRDYEYRLERGDGRWYLKRILWLTNDGDFDIL